MSAEDLLANQQQDAVTDGQLLANSLGVVPEHSLHFAHVSQSSNPYDIAGVGSDLSYGAFPLHESHLQSPHTFPLPHPSILSQQRKTERRKPPGKKNSDQPHIPRPRNAFILFRSAFIEQKNGKELASKQQNLSRIAAMVWKSMNSAEQDPWYKLAAEEKQAHYAANPGYTFQPTGRGEFKKKTRKPTTEPAVEENSCKRIADLIISGVQGDDLITAAKTEGVAPYQRAKDQTKRRNPAVPDPTAMGMSQLMPDQAQQEDDDSESDQPYGNSPGSYGYVA